MLRIESCTARYGTNEVFRGLDLEVRRGATACVIGPTGSGKSTLLRLAAGLAAPAAGRVTLAGRPVQLGDLRVGLVLQGYGLFPWMTALANVELGLRIRGVDPSVRRARAGLWLERLGLTEAADAYPAALSGGQQQRVALARTLALEPELLLLDEPFSAVDAITREYLQDTLVGLLARRSLVTVLVTHDITEAAYLGDEIHVLTGGPSRVLRTFGGSARPLGERTRDGWVYAARCREVRLFLEAQLGGPS